MQNQQWSSHKHFDPFDFKSSKAAKAQKPHLNSFLKGLTFKPENE